MLARLLKEYTKDVHITLPTSVLTVQGPTVDWGALEASHPWVRDCKLVVKPDQLIKRRGKGGLLALNVDWAGARTWIESRMGSEVVVDGVSGRLTHFLVEPFVPHPQSDEYYVCINSVRAGEEILFYHAGGVDIGDVDSKAQKLLVPIGDGITAGGIAASQLLAHVPASRAPLLASFIASLFALYYEAQFAYLEINPLVVTGDEHTAAAGGQVTSDGHPRIIPLDLAAKIDEAGAFLAASKWGPIEFPPSFGREPLPEEAYIREMDGKTGASLKLTILNRAGRVWTMVAGGGASVVYADTISDMGFGGELANYGEYSGAPSDSQTYEYAKTILKCMGEAGKHPSGLGKVLIIGGGIANFTDVAKTFTGIIKALKEAGPMLREQKVSIWVRRGGPNYQEGLKMMRGVGSLLGTEVHVYGPETHITAIVALALGKPETLHGLKVIEECAEDALPLTPNSSFGGETPKPSRAATPSSAVQGGAVAHPAAAAVVEGAAASTSSLGSHTQFSPSTRCIVFGMQQRAVQGMLDFDYLCKRQTPSVAAMVFPFSGNHYIKFYWGQSEVMMPVYETSEEALRRHPEVRFFSLARASLARG